MCRWGLQAGAVAGLMASAPDALAAALGVIPADDTKAVLLQVLAGSTR